jgi:hypothetical protein
VSGGDFFKPQIGRGHVEDFSVLADLYVQGQTDSLV